MLTQESGCRCYSNVIIYKYLVLMCMVLNGVITLLYHTHGHLLINVLIIHLLKMMSFLWSMVNVFVI